MCLCCDAFLVITVVKGDFLSHRTLTSLINEAFPSSKLTKAPQFKIIHQCEHDLQVHLTDEAWEKDLLTVVCSPPEFVLDIANIFTALKGQTCQDSTWFGPHMSQVSLRPQPPCPIRFAIVPPLVTFWQSVFDCFSSI